MPQLILACSAAEFLEEFYEEDFTPADKDGWYEYHPYDRHPHQWWGLF